MRRRQDQQCQYPRLHPQQAQARTRAASPFLLAHAPRLLRRSHPIQVISMPGPLPRIGKPLSLLSMRPLFWSMQHLFVTLYNIAEPHIYMTRTVQARRECDGSKHTLWHLSNQLLPDQPQNNSWHRRWPAGIRIWYICICVDGCHDRQIDLLGLVCSLCNLCTLLI